MDTQTISMRLKALNPKPLGESHDTDLLVVFIYADGQLIVDLNKGLYATDWEQLMQSIHASGTFEIFTCTCGIAGCAGIWEGVKVKQVGPNVIWHVTEPGEPRFYLFEREQLQIAAEACLQRGRRHVAGRHQLTPQPFKVVPEWRTTRHFMSQVEGEIF